MLAAMLCCTGFEKEEEELMEENELREEGITLGTRDRLMDVC